LNPYAAPKAKLEEALPAGAAWRDGKLVRMDREGALPDRCVLCNAPAGKRVARTLYWSPAAWRHFSWIVPFGLLIAGIGLRVPWMALAFWPLVIVLGIAHYFVRKKLKLELAICVRHERQGNILAALSIAAVIAAVAFGALQIAGNGVGLVLVLASVVALGVLQRYAGVHSISLKKLDADHAWLGGTGRTFREALPELPAA
jgi:hypothetical protein